jgi:hypothetical protein
MGPYRRIGSSRASQQKRMAGILLVEIRGEMEKLPAPTAPLATANSQRKETAECKDIKG